MLWEPTSKFSVTFLKGFDDYHLGHRDFILDRDEALRLVPKTCEYIFPNAKVLQMAYNKGYAN
jgi:hypothetical protein